MSKKAFKQRIYNKLKSVCNGNKDGKFISNKGQICYNSVNLIDVTDTILNDKRIGKYYEFHSLENLLIKLFVNFYKRTNNYKKCCKIISNFIVNNNPQVYMCLIPIHGVALTAPFHLKGITIYPASKLGSKIKDCLQDLDVHTKGINETVKELKKESSRNLNFALVRRKAVTPNGAMRIAIRILDSFIESLHFVDSRLNKIHDIGIGNQTQTMIDKNLMCISVTNTNIAHPYKYSPLPVNLDMINSKNKILSYIRIISKTEYNLENHLYNYEINIRLLNANNLIGKGLESYNFKIQFLMFMSSIECLVENKESDQTVTQQVCNRVAWIIGKNEKSREHIYERMKQLYSVRSRIAHGELIKASHLDINDLLYIARVLQSTIFDIRSEFFEKNNHSFRQLMSKYFIRKRFS